MAKSAKLAVALGLVLATAGFLPATAQMEEVDIEVLGPEVDELLVADLGPEMPDFGPIAARPPGPHGFRGPCPHGGKGECPDDGLSLTDEQREKAYQLKTDYLSKIGPKMIELKVAKRDMKDLMTRPQVDKAKVTELQNKINEQKTAIANLRLEKRLAFLDLLSEDQRKDLRKKVMECGPCPMTRGFRGRFHH